MQLVKPLTQLQLLKDITTSNVTVASNTGIYMYVNRRTSKMQYAHVHRDKILSKRLQPVFVLSN